MDKSELARRNFIAAVQERDNEENADLQRMLVAIENDLELKDMQDVRTHWDETRLFTWVEFCNEYQMNGDRFTEALAPLMELKTIALCDTGHVTLREFGGNNMVMKVEYLVSGEETDLKLWVYCAMFLARNPKQPFPACMNPDVHRPAGFELAGDLET